MTEATSRTLKEGILDELAAWSAECSDIARELRHVPGDTEEEAAGHEARAETATDLAGRLRTAIVAEKTSGQTGETIDIYPDDLTDIPTEPAYRYEAYCAVPFPTSAVGGIVGYSDASAADASDQLRIILRDLGLDPTTFRFHDESGVWIPPPAP